MTEILLGIVVVCLLAVIGLQVALLLRKVGVDLSPLQHKLDGIDKSYERVKGPCERRSPRTVARHRLPPGSPAKN